MVKARASLVVALFVAAVVVAPYPAAAKAKCAPGGEGGEWRGYGHDLHNTRSQPKEDSIDTTSARLLAPKWTFSIGDAGGTGGFQSTPTIADGCMYVATSGGWVFALNADTGELVWKQDLAKAAKVQGGSMFAVSVEQGHVYATVSPAEGPRAVAFDQDTGDIEWITRPLNRGKGAWVNSSPVFFDGMLFLGLSGGEAGNEPGRIEGDREARGSFALLHAATGRVIKETWVIPDKDFKKYAGAGIWATAVIDEKTRYAFVGTGNPYGPTRDYKTANAIIKIDVDRSRKTFGEIVDIYKGDYDQYLPALDALNDSPACTAVPPTIDYPQCGQLDLDFGASPNLFKDESGNVLVGELQKSGVYHAAHADTMSKAWTTVVGLPCALCNAGTSAVEDDTVYGVATPGGQLYALNASTGAFRWMSPIADGVHYQATSVANGVVYAVDTKGVFHAIDGTTGLPLLERPMAADTGSDACTTLGGGVAIARHTVYATCDTGATKSGWIIAYSTGG